MTKTLHIFCSNASNFLDLGYDCSLFLVYSNFSANIIIWNLLTNIYELIIGNVYFHLNTLCIKYQYCIQSQENSTHSNEKIRNVTALLLSKKRNTHTHTHTLISYDSMPCNSLSPVGTDTLYIFKSLCLLSRYKCIVQNLFTNILFDNNLRIGQPYWNRFCGAI